MNELTPEQYSRYKALKEAGKIGTIWYFTNGICYLVPVNTIQRLEFAEPIFTFYLRALIDYWYPLVDVEVFERKQMQSERMKFNKIRERMVG